MFSNIGLPEILIIMFIFLIFFGAKKIPELAQGLGKGMREFKKALRDVEDEIKTSDQTDNSDKNKKA